MTNWKCLDKVDWDLLLKQKKALIDVADLMNRPDAFGSFIGSKEQLEAIDGVITFLDALQDEAEKKGIWD